ncbi:ATP-binding protein [Cyclobacterium sp.]|uniref:sensor histidine kinase n=1 Tax=Cyclobacterium sp. TaxID=1966343 RepID=UPI0019985DD8|nr:ATP-binding protein [Cyclobacterium sp.]MBD3628290.1 ATP-binding protein [Cyclobacterium sp.]
MTEVEVRKLLEDTLQKEPNNYNRILELSSLLSSFDNQNIRFSVDAGVINRLGRELVGRHETAVAELVKNAYDADATKVDLYFENCFTPGGKLTIEDDGHGMTRDQLVKGFMTISSSDKIHNPKSPKFNRVRAGQKGIGRFATQRIGEVLTIITQTKESNMALKLVVNWNQYEMDSNLILISNQVKEIQKQKDEGTTLIIEKVRDGWSEAMLRRSFRYVSELLQPYPLSERLSKSENDSGFLVSIFRNGELIIDDQSEFFQHALADIEAYVDENGQGYYGFSSDKLNIAEEVYLIGKSERETPFESLKNIHLKAHYFIYNSNKSSYLPKSVNSYILGNARKNGGIKLYRNGFRVPPYGQKDDDWIGLDASVRRNSLITPHGNINFFGFVEVVDPKGEMFQEQSSREGLLINQSLGELQDFVYKALTDMTIKISHIRERKGTAGQKEWEKKSSKELLQDVKKDVSELIETADSQIFDSVSKDSEGNISVKLKSVDQKLNEYQETQQEEQSQAERDKQELLREIQLLRILAGLGLTIGEFVHEIGHYEPAFKYDTEFLLSLIESEDGKKAGLRLSKNLESLTVYTSYFKEAISNNINRELEPIEIRDVVFDFENAITPDLLRNGIELKYEFKGYNLFTCPMHKSEWSSILFNLYTNSKKAISKTGRKGIIYIEGGIENGKIFFTFSDNGIGIPEKDREHVFEAFFTTSPPTGKSSNEIEELTGTGLGLKIIKDIVEGYGGDVLVDNPSNGCNTTIRIELPKLDEK